MPNHKIQLSIFKVSSILILALLLVTSSLYAAKARRGATLLTLSDGSIVSAILQGDENLHYYALLDGTPLQRGDDGKYHKVTSLPASFKATTRASGIGTATPSYFPHTGSPRALVILVQFQDVKFKSPDPVVTFNHYLNAEMGASLPEANLQAYRSEEEYNNYGSVKQYFHDMSDGKFIPQFDVVGPVTVSQNSSYYGSDINGNDANNAQMISEACALVADQVDYSKYDADNDGFVDLVYVIYAGYSQSISGNPEDCIWPKSGVDNFYQYTSEGIKVSPQRYLMFNGKRIARYGINNELNGKASETTGKKLFLLNGIGLFCHEFSHTLGFSDHYSLPGSIAEQYDNQSPEYWDLMDAGEYTDNGYRPTPYSPWEKMIMGWAEPITLEGTQAQQATLEPYDIDSKAYKIDADVKEGNNRAKGEYLLLQNIRNEGWYKSLPGYGLLVWRIDYSDLDVVKLEDFPNNTAGKPRVMIVPADGLVINQMNCGEKGKYTWDEYDASLANDPFPAYNIGEGGSDINSLTEVQFNWSTMTSRPLYNIVKHEDTGLVTFDYLQDFTSTDIPMPLIHKNKKIGKEYYNLEGRKVTYLKDGNIYIDNLGNKVVFHSK